MKNSENKINLCIKTTTLLLCLLIISLTFCSCKSSTANDEKQVSENPTPFILKPILTEIYTFQLKTMFQAALTPVWNRQKI